MLTATTVADSQLRWVARGSFFTWGVKKSSNTEVSARGPTRHHGAQITEGTRGQVHTSGSTERGMSVRELCSKRGLAARGRKTYHPGQSRDPRPSPLGTPAATDVHVGIPSDSASAEVAVVLPGRQQHLGFPLHSADSAEEYDTRGGEDSADGREAMNMSAQAGYSAAGITPGNTPHHDGDTSGSDAGQASNKRVRRTYSAPVISSAAAAPATRSKTSHSPPSAPCPSSEHRRKGFPVLLTHAGWLKWDWNTALCCASTESGLYSPDVLCRLTRNVND